MTFDAEVKRKKLPEDLPRNIIEYDLDESQKACDCCGEQMEKIGSENSEQLDYIPASLRVIEHVRLKYACKQCEQKVVTAFVTGHGSSLPVPVHRRLLPGPPIVVLLFSTGRLVAGSTA